MLRHTLWLIACATLLSASSVQSLVETTFAHNYTLVGLEKAIKSADENIKLARKWQNPTLTLGVNDIQTDDVSKRDLEPMQAHYIGLSQSVPLSNRIDIQEAIAKKDKKITQYVLEETKLKLKSKIVELYYTLAILEKKRTLFTQYLNNIEQLQALNKALYENDKVLHTQVLKTQILYERTKLKVKKLDTLIQNMYLKLEEIIQQPIQSVEAILKPELKTLTMDYTQHPQIQMQHLKVQRFNDVEQLEYEKKIPDVKVNVAYFQRDDKYEDYFNFSVGIPLSIYGSENIKALQAKSKMYEARSKLEGLKLQFKTNTAVIQNEFNNAYESYAMLQNVIIPIKQQVQEALEAYNTLQKAQPQALISNLNELLDFEMSALDEQKNYYSYLAQAIYYGYTLEQ